MSQILEHRIVDVKVLGVKRTSERWLRSYINITPPTFVTDEDIQYIKEKLMTTGVFRDVEVYFTVPAFNLDAKILTIAINEKWTTIPVVRGEYGGGTPLTVLGIYDTHVMGRLWTMGFETRKYGDAKRGYVGWIKAPRLKGGYSLGLELWNDIRRRSVYDRNFEELGYIQSKEKKVRALFLFPLFQKIQGLRSDSWQYGLDIDYKITEPSEFVRADGSNIEREDFGFIIPKEKEKSFSAMGVLIRDGLSVNNLEIHGLRWVNKLGPFTEEGSTKLKYEGELFGYYMSKYGVNYAAHLSLNYADSKLMSSQKFLGGLDSIRGIPDGAVYGPKAFYANFEARYIGFKFKHVWLQNVAFLDAGEAHKDINPFFKDTRSAAGIGVRIAFPKIYRLVLRLDYAWSLTSKGQGLSAGMNQFFQPYRPL